MMLVKDFASANSLGYNRETYEKLKLALTLGLRRQIFLAVCDNLRLRNRLAARLKADMASETVGNYPSLVSLKLNLAEPSPIAQLKQWLDKHPPPGLEVPSPSFQILGVERLTRCPTSLQWFFLNELRNIESSMLGLDSSLLLWLPRPWTHSIQQSAPEFWRYRTGLFEFEGEPTPMMTVVEDAQQFDRSAVEVPPELPPEWQGQNGTKERKDRQEIAPNISFVDRELEQEIPEGRAIPEKPATPAPPRAQPRQKLPGEEELIELVLAQEQDKGQNLEDIAPSDFLPWQIVQQIEQLQEQPNIEADLADAYLSLGNFYRDAISAGNSSVENLAIAIRAYELVLQLVGEESSLWGDLANDIGNFYWMISRSGANSQERILFLEQAIKTYQDALDKIDLEQRPDAWATITNNLGTVYSELAPQSQNPTDNLQQSILAYRQALPYRKADPRAYASTQNNLGTAYWNLAQYAEPEANLKQALAAYKESLSFYDPELYPLDYGMIHNNLGTAYWNLSQYEEGKENLMLALRAYQVAAMYRTPQTAPAACAATQNNLGTAYLHLADRCVEETALWIQLLNEAIAAYTTALKVAAQIHPTPVGFDVFVAHNNLGLAYYHLGTMVDTEAEENGRRLHLEAALSHHLEAVRGSQQQQENLSETALGYILQTIRAFYAQFGVEGQSLALSRVPGHLLPDILPRLSRL